MPKPIVPLLIIGIAGLVVLSGCAGTGAPMKDCGSDQVCFESAVKSCERAKGRATDTTGSVTYGEVRGGTPASCTVYMKVEKGSGVTALFEGKEMECTGLPVLPGATPPPGTDFCKLCKGSMADILCQLTSSLGSGLGTTPTR